MKKILFFILLSLVCSCESDELPTGRDVLVVEGWIDDGGFPVVIVTKNLPLTEQSFNMDELSDKLVRWAKVSVVCDGDTTILTGMMNKAYFPPFIYTTSKMRGMSGKAYQLLVDYNGEHIEAVTTIPPRPDVDSLIVSNVEGNDTLYKVRIFFKDNPQERNFYKAFVRVGTQSRQFRSCYLGTVSDDVLQENNVMTINRGAFFNDSDYSPYFFPNDTILVKFAQIDESSFHFWSDYENHDSFSTNPMFPVSMNIRTNIQGGVGYWCGCGAVTYPVTFPVNIPRF